MRITDAYRDANRHLHETNANYGTTGRKHVVHVAELVCGHKFTRILDYGCGKGTLASSLPDIAIAEYDPAIPGKDAEPQSAQLVVCTDVLEHIEPGCLDDVLSHLMALTEQLLYANISTRPAVKFLADGRNAHLIIENPRWWNARIAAHADIVQWNEKPESLSFLARPKPSA